MTIGKKKDKFKIKCQVSEGISCFSLINWLKIHYSSIHRTSGRQMNLRSAICWEPYTLNRRTMVYKGHLHKGVACCLKLFLRCSKEKILQWARIYGAWPEGTLIPLNAKQARNKLIPQQYGNVRLPKSEIHRQAWRTINWMLPIL